MFLKKVFKALTPSLKTKIGHQISAHKSSGYSFDNYVVCYIGKDYGGPYINAYIVSNNPYAGGLSTTGQIWFFKSRVDSYFQALDEVTLQVSQARSKYPGIEFWRWLHIPEGFPKEKIQKWSSIDQAEKAKIIEKGNDNRETSVHLFELYKSGSWDISNHPPGYDEYDEYEIY